MLAVLQMAVPASSALLQCCFHKQFVKVNLSVPRHYGAWRRAEPRGPVQAVENTLCSSCPSLHKGHSSLDSELWDSGTAVFYYTSCSKIFTLERPIWSQKRRD